MLLSVARDHPWHSLLRCLSIRDPLRIYPKYDNYERRHDWPLALFLLSPPHILQVEHVVPCDNADDPAVLFDQYCLTCLQSPRHFSKTCVDVKNRKTRFHDFAHGRVQKFPVAHNFCPHATLTQRTNCSSFFQDRNLREPELIHLFQRSSNS